MKLLRTAARSLSAILVAVAVSQVQPAAALGGLASHRAIYELQLLEADDRSGIADMDGRIVIEFSGSNCDGYTLNMRRVLRVQTSDGTINTFDTSTRSWESGDGSQMSFGSQLFINAKPSEELAGNANRGANGEDGAASFELPEETILDLPPETVFPVEHTLAIVAAALDGEVMSRSVVFDGGEVGTIYKAVTFIGEPLEPDELVLPEDPDLAAELASQPAWPVTVTYYELTETLSGEQLPAYEVRLNLFQNGISTDFTMVYEGFSLSANLSNLELITQATCD